MLVNVELVNQLLALSNDGQPPEDARAQCVAAVVKAAVDAIAPGHTDRTPDWYHDQVYGQGYLGAMDPQRFSGLLATLGVQMVQLQSPSGDQLVAWAHQYIAQGKPVAAAIPSEWGDTTAADIAARGGPTHEICFCDVRGDTLVAMNPWPIDGRNAFYQVAPIAWWASRLVYGRVNVFEGAAHMTYTINGDGSITFPNAITLKYAHADEVKAAGAPRADDQPVRPEYYIGTTLSVVEWQSGEVWTWIEARSPQLNRYGGVDVATALGSETATLQAQLDEAKSQVAQLQSAAATVAAATVAAAGAASADAEAAVAALAKALATAKAS